ncbi:hypothetical protein KBY25_21065 [Ruegeria pomeroyi]|nr:hypothetical protein [Ruegeria pomeroyi]
MTKNCVSANGPAMSRRAILSALPASGVALTAPQLAQAQTHDPILPLYQEWLDARGEWRELADLPGNGNWDDPRSAAAAAREDVAEQQMFTLQPTTLEGIGALAAVAWCYVKPDCTDPEEFAELAKSYDCRAVMAIWKACTGQDGYPVT